MARDWSVAAAKLALLVVLGAGAQASFADSPPPQPPASPQAQVANCAKGTAGAIYGVCLGVPIKCTKLIYSESHRMVQTLRNDLSDEPSVSATLLARTMGVPYGIVSGGILGLIHGVGGGACDGFREPFSKKSIGLK